MGKENLSEKTALTKDEITAKIKRLNGYIAKAEGRIKTHEKALSRLREQIKKEISKTLKSVIRGKIYG